jgi:CPA2 family monovalent cation:H+ antiporter-2
LPPEISLLVELGIIAGSALALSLVTWVLRLPAVLGQLIAGMIIGPFGLKLVTDLATIGAMAEIGIVLLLFIIGLELDPVDLMTMKTKVLVFSFTEISISFIAGLLAGFLLGWPIRESILLAWVIGISSTALVAKMLHERGTFTQRSTPLMMSALIVEDIIAVIILSLLPSLAAGGVEVLSGLGAWILRGILLIVLIFVLGVYVAPRAIDRISQLDLDVDEAGFLLSISLGFAMAILSQMLGFSAATGAFLMGLAIRGKRAKFVHGKVRPVRDLFLIIFFVSMGMLVDPSQFLNVGVVLPVVALALIGKYSGSYLAAVASAERRDANNIAIGMTPRGEFSFIIARDALATGAARALIYPMAGTVVIATTLVSALAQIPRKGRWKRFHSMMATALRTLVG